MRILRRGAPTAVAALALCVVPASAGATTIHVTTTADSGAACTLRNAITAANSDGSAGACAAGQAAPTVDTIDFTGVGGPQITLGGALPQITESVAIAGPGASQLAIDGNNQYQPLFISSGVVSISGLTITHGRCGASCGSEGGAIFLSTGTLTLDSDVLSANTAASAIVGNPNSIAEGGAIEVQAGTTLHVLDSAFTGNTVTGSGATSQNGSTGGAIMDRGTATIARSTIDGNMSTSTATGGATANATGGGVTNNGSLAISQSTISNNTVSTTGTIQGLNGGGIFEFNNPANSLVVDRSTVVNNTVTPAASGVGGGIYVLGAPATVRSSTISGNSAHIGANLFVGQPINLSDSIVTNPQVGNSCSGAVVSGGFNLESTDTCGLNQPSDLKSTAPMLGSLADNGGPTDTRAPLTGSPVIDKGTAAAGELLDQRGLLRPSDVSAIANAPGGDGSDIGAVEIQDTVAPDTVIDSGPAEGLTINAPPSFTFSSTESASTFQCSIDDGPFAGCSSPDVLSSLGDGPHTFAVRAVDGTHNADPTPASRAFTLHAIAPPDTTAPETTLGKLKKKTTKRTVKVVLNASESGSTFECRVDSKPFKPCVSPYKTKKLKPGKHSIEVRATDPAGNTDPTPARGKIKVLDKG